MSFINDFAAASVASFKKKILGASCTDSSRQFFIARISSKKISFCARENPFTPLISSAPPVIFMISRATSAAFSSFMYSGGRTPSPFNFSGEIRLSFTLMSSRVISAEADLFKICKTEAADSAGE